MARNIKLFALICGALIQAHTFNGQICAKIKQLYFLMYKTNRLDFIMSSHIYKKHTPEPAQNSAQKSQNNPRNTTPSLQ